MIVIFWMRADRNARNAVNIKKYASNFSRIRYILQEERAQWSRIRRRKALLNSSAIQDAAFT